MSMPSPLTRYMRSGFAISTPRNPADPRPVQTNVHLPALHPAAHGFVVATGRLPCRPADQHAIWQPVEKQLVEPVEMPRHYAVHVAEEAHVRESEADIGRRIAQGR